MIDLLHWNLILLRLKNLALKHRGVGYSKYFRKKNIIQNKAHDGANRFIPSRTGAPVKDKKGRKNAQNIFVSNFFNGTNRFMPLWLILEDFHIYQAFLDVTFLGPLIFLVGGHIRLIDWSTYWPTYWST